MEDPDGDNPYLISSELPKSSEIKNNRFTWIPTYEDSGEYTFNLIAVSKGLFTEKYVRIIVNDTDRASIFGEIEKIIGNEEQIVEFSINAIDPDGDSVIIRCDNLPRGAYIEDKKFIWTPTYEDSGEHEVDIIAESNGKEVIKRIKIEIINMDRSPVIKMVQDITILEDSELSVKLDITDMDSDEISVIIENMQKGMEFDKKNNTFIWKPNFSQAGEYNIAIVADSKGKKVKESFNITVENMNRVPILDMVKKASTRPDKLLKIDIGYTDPDNDNVELSYESEIELNFDENGGTLHWTPDYNDIGKNVVVIKASDGQSEIEKRLKLNVRSMEGYTGVSMNPYLDTGGNIGYYGGVMSWRDRIKRVKVGYGFEMERMSYQKETSYVVKTQILSTGQDSLLNQSDNVLGTLGTLNLEFPIGLLNKRGIRFVNYNGIGNYLREREYSDLSGETIREKKNVFGLKTGIELDYNIFKSAVIKSRTGYRYVEEFYSGVEMALGLDLRF